MAEPKQSKNSLDENSEGVTMKSTDKSGEPMQQWSTDVDKPASNPAEARDADHGILDPAETGHRLPEGLERERRGPLNKDTGRRHVSS